jgi:hypothetical protein
MKDRFACHNLDPGPLIRDLFVSVAGGFVWMRGFRLVTIEKLSNEHENLHSRRRYKP